MKVLICNSGSSSLKVKLLEMPGERELARGLVERIGDGQDPARLTCRLSGENPVSRGIASADHRQALGLLLDELGCADIFLVGHRLVHGGHLFAGATLVDDRSLAQMETLRELAPLHMPPALAVVRACRDLLPGARQVACFDTSFYLSMPAKAYLYAVPREWYTEHGVRRFGFHGLSHQYVTLAAADLLGLPLDRLKLISAHLGNGASITAFDGGRVLDTSMGFTPLEGLIMGTRAGYLDPAVLLYLQRRTGMDLEQMVDLLNTQSGLQAISGRSRDLRTILAARAEGDADATLAVEMYVHTLRKYIGGYCFALSGCQALVFTAGVGENSAELRALALEGLEDFGLCLDPAANARTVGAAGLISASHSKVKVLVIPTDEERMIARQAYALV
ncbi:MAG: acetate kinase [Desulfobacterales bacterium]|nr:acetate kinase [Desulfobacterales bacterium]